MKVYCIKLIFDGSIKFKFEEFKAITVGEYSFCFKNESGDGNCLAFKELEHLHVSIKNWKEIVGEIFSLNKNNLSEERVKKDFLKYCYDSKIWLESFKR